MKPQSAPAQPAQGLTLPTVLQMLGRQLSKAGRTFHLLFTGSLLGGITSEVFRHLIN
ncbi:hypothetical protein CLV63_1457 [Murinocardiopsis flavida]|uniref:Uncharacterized protein n=1 Tax=Murinocardiopsis flavida TaxID=645275 RepID=A0A2P8CA82_9ACTN|nr:hypothetical protein [Murinocardiopsis flavida]PSK81886.1 hypothetical protein CLV63_1457 [Murinocardiopsis flavida]